LDSALRRQVTATNFGNAELHAGADRSTDVHSRKPPRRWFLLIATLTASVLSGTIWAGAATKPSGRDLVVGLLRTRLSLQANELAVIRLRAREGELPRGTDEYYVEFRGSRHDNTNCLVFSGRAYCGHSNGEYARFLQDFRYFDNADLETAKVMRLYALLALPRQSRYMSGETYRRYPPATPPVLTKTAEGMTLVFFALRPPGNDPDTLARWEVSLSRSYEVAVR
jgi:hypothetical protein